MIVYRRYLGTVKCKVAEKDWKETMKMYLLAVSILRWIRSLLAAILSSGSVESTEGPVSSSSSPWVLILPLKLCRLWEKWLKITLFCYYYKLYFVSVRVAMTTPASIHPVFRFSSLISVCELTGQAPGHNWCVWASDSTWFVKPVDTRPTRPESIYSVKKYDLVQDKFITRISSLSVL